AAPTRGRPSAQGRGPGPAELPGEPWAHGGPAAGARPAPGPASGSQPVQVHRLFGMGEGRSGARRIKNPNSPTRLSGHRMTKEDTMQRITPCLWFNDNAEKAVEFYTSFRNSKITTV